MWLRKRVRDNLEIMTNPEFENPGPDLGEHAIIKSPAAAQAATFRIKGKARAKEDIDFLHRDFLGSLRGFEDTECPRTQGIPTMEGQVIANDLRKNPLSIGVTENRRGQIHLTRQRGIGRHRDDFRMTVEPAIQRRTGGR